MIATSTSVDISDVKVPESVNDAYFAKAKAAKTTKEGEFFGEGKQQAEVSEEKKSEQKVCSSSELESKGETKLTVGPVCRLCSAVGCQEGREPRQVLEVVLGSFEG